MAHPRNSDLPCALLFLLVVLSSFNVLLADETSAKTPQTPDLAAADSSEEDSKEKRSQEEILFGNQQNRPNGLVDDLMSMSDSTEDSSNVSQAQDVKSEEEEEKRSAEEIGPERWYSSPAALQYLTALKTMPAGSLYDQEDLYRRKRQLRGSRKRSFRSSLEQMIQKRGIRMPRRLKRQVDVEDLLNLFGNYDEEVTPHSFSGRARTVSKRHVPGGRFAGYPAEYRYPYVFQHRDDGVLSAANEGDNDDVEDMMLLPPNSRYIDAPPDGELLPYRTREEENEGIQKWLSRHTVPSVFRVSRRSAPFFYPIDYRYIPGYKKRSGKIHFTDEEPEADFGKWGHVVPVPEAYASPEDIARLYGLASLLSEGDQQSP